MLAIDAETIVALATPPGFGACGLIRISGPLVPTICESLLQPTVPSARCAVRSNLILDNTARLPVLALRFPGPGSLTGEDVLELLTVSSPVVTQRVLQTLTRIAGVRLAQPGEFLARAFLYGKISLAQAEGVAALIAARSDEEAHAARELAKGATAARYEALTDALAHTLALVEAGIDFTDQEDVVAIDRALLATRLREASHEVLSLLTQDTARAPFVHELRVVLFGEPNAGKSTLFNALLGRPRAVVSDIAGTTRDVLSEPLDLSSHAPSLGTVLLQDSPGLQAAQSEVEHAAQSGAAHAASQADVVVWCDPSGEFHGTPPGRRVLRVCTKMDSHTTKRPDALSVCAIDARGLHALREALSQQCLLAVHDSGVRGLGALLPRHREALAAAHSAIARAMDVVESHGAAPEVTAQLLRDAIEPLAALTGRMDPDDIIGLIFARFCVGK